MNTDPISDFLTRIRNANLVGKTTVKIPYSNIKSNIANILKEEGFITSYQVENEDSIKNINLNLSYKPEGTPQINGLKRISKPGHKTDFALIKCLSLLNENFVESKYLSLGQK